jgi:serine/threonine protein kinase
MDISSTLTQGGGTAAYMAPEQSSGDTYGNEVDVFAFGFILWEIFKADQVFKDIAARGQMYVHKRVCDGLRPPIGGIPDKFSGLISACWEQAPSSRPTFDYIFKSLKDDKWALLDDVDTEVIDRYVQKVLDFEARNPPKPLEW